MDGNGKTIKLNDGTIIPLIGLGTHKLIDPENSVYNAIKAGARLIDTATRYKNEPEVGKGIERALKDGIVKREELIIIGKVWLDMRKDPEKALRDTLKKFHIEYIDLYLDHWPYGKDYRKEKVDDPFENISTYEVWEKMQALVKKGLIKSLGVSNYNIQALSDLLSFCTIRPQVNEVEFNPNYYQKDLKDFCDKENIAIIAYLPLCPGVEPLNHIQEHEGEFDDFEEKIFKDLAEKYTKTKGQIILNWYYCMNIISIPSTSKDWRMKENLEALDFKMDEKDINLICKYAQQTRQKKFVLGNKYFGVNILG